MDKTNKRLVKDVGKLVSLDYEIEIKADNMSEFTIILDGPQDSPYEGGKWKLLVTLPEQYPYKSPSIGFLNKIFHPNIDEASGSVCLDVINQTWSPMYELRNVFEVFLPQLLLYPNPTDPLNGDAANLMMTDKDKYEAKIRSYVKKYGSLDKVGANDEADQEPEEEAKVEDSDGDNSSDPASQLSDTPGVNSDKELSDEDDDMDDSQDDSDK
ncbi:unnamed protein product [Moneuplotes crassus]|uniref:Ubiquitin-conjugating enzyme E2 H n=1 Tax=Euplotes crassus TaxID=5936 RepID=A0AAD2CYQ3_EUPCR|nr:unnamed protein product [Moneuplotes crassus]